MRLRPYATVPQPAAQFFTPLSIAPSPHRHTGVSTIWMLSLVGTRIRSEQGSTRSNSIVYPATHVGDKHRLNTSPYKPPPPTFLLFPLFVLQVSIEGCGGVSIHRPLYLREVAQTTHAFLKRNKGRPWIRIQCSRSSSLSQQARQWGGGGFNGLWARPYEDHSGAGAIHQSREGESKKRNQREVCFEHQKHTNGWCTKGGDCHDRQF